MTLLASAPDWLVALLLLFLLLAALEDAWRLEISDYLSGGIAIGAFIAILLIGPGVGLWENFLLFAAVLFLGTLLFARGAMGGGDVKLLAACVLWFDLSGGWKLLVAIAIAGGVEALLILGLRQFRWSEWMRQRVLLLRPREGIPYGIAVALGVALMTYWLRT
jgi:prepilin peptidase CpaA